MKRMIPVALCLALCACGGTRVVDLNDKDEVQSMQHVMELEYRDFNAPLSIIDCVIFSPVFVQSRYSNSITCCID